MRLTKFKIEPLGYETYYGFTKDETWNGWDCPYFTFEQAQKVMKTHNVLLSAVGRKSFALYDSTLDAFVFLPTDEDEPEIFAAITENGEKYYPVGAFYWIWEETS